jgi:hypothetical protein
MSIDESSGMEIFDEEKYREIIIDFIQTHPGCIAEDILRTKSNRAKKIIQNPACFKGRKDHH